MGCSLQQVGAGLDWPSRNDTNWLSRRFSWPVETHEWFGWFKMVSILCAFSERKFGDLREVMARGR